MQPALTAISSRHGPADLARRAGPTGAEAILWRARTASAGERGLALECPFGDAAQLYSTSDVVSQRGPNYAGQDQEDGRQGQAEAHADRLSKLVRLKFRRPLCRGRHVAGVHPARGRVEHFWI